MVCKTKGRNRKPALMISAAVSQAFALPLPFAFSLPLTFALPFAFTLAVAIALTLAVALYLKFALACPVAVVLARLRLLEAIVKVGRRRLTRRRRLCHHAGLINFKGRRRHVHLPSFRVVELAKRAPAR